MINLQTELNYLDSVNIFKIFSLWPDPTHQPTQPPTQPPNCTPTHGEILHRFQIFKQNWNILISSSIIKFLLILGSTPWGVADGWMGWGWVWACEGLSHAHTHAHTCTCTHACMHMHVKHANHAKHGCLHVGSHLQFLYKCTCAYVWTVPKYRSTSVYTSSI